MSSTTSHVMDSCSKAECSAPHVACQSLPGRSTVLYVDIAFLFSTITVYGTFHCSQLALTELLLSSNRVNQCVGELNYRYFLLFLFTNSAFFYYATYVLAWILLVQIDRQRLFSLTFIDRDTGTEYAATFWIVLQYVLVRYTSIVVLLLLAVVMGTAVL